MADRFMELGRTQVVSALGSPHWASKTSKPNSVVHGIHLPRRPPKQIKSSSEAALAALAGKLHSISGTPKWEVLRPDPREVGSRKDEIR